MYTTLRLSGGDLGRGKMQVLCDLSRAESPVQVDYCEGRGWQPTQYQCADCRGTQAGLEAIARRLCAEAIEMTEAEVEVEVAVVSGFTRVGDGYYVAADDSEYVVVSVRNGYVIRRGDGDITAPFGSKHEAHEAAELLASGERSDEDYEWSRN